MTQWQDSQSDNQSYSAYTSSYLKLIKKRVWDKCSMSTCTWYLYTYIILVKYTWRNFLLLLYAFEKFHMCHEPINNKELTSFSLRIFLSHSHHIAHIENLIELLISLCFFCLFLCEDFKLKCLWDKKILFNIIFLRKFLQDFCFINFIKCEKKLRCCYDIHGIFIHWHAADSIFIIAYQSRKFE